MKHIYLLIASMLVTYLPLNAQISEGGDPLSIKSGISFEGIEQAQLAPFNLEQVMAEDAEDEKAGNYPKIGRVRPLAIDLNNVDSWTDVKGGKLWRMALKSRDAKGLSVQFEDFNLPSGGKLFIYSADYKHVIGAFSDFNNHESGVFSTELIPGDEVIVEYFEPTAAEGLGQFKIAGLVHAYRMVPGTEIAQRDFGDSDPCQVNVNCSEGNNWQNQKRGVVRIFIIEGQFAGWCSGSLVNNTAEDCTPYVLTALHCGMNASTNNMNQWVFFFNYESSGCANGLAGQVPNNSMTGCARIADSGDGGGNNGSDYMLVELNNDIPSGYNPHYNGWRRNNVTSSSGVSIHHPSGDIKKISTYTNNLQTTNWGSAAGSHWMVTWSGTANGHGVTEGGSSGSPVFDNQGLIIGTLTGGSSYCNSVVPGGQTQPDLYGKMSYHWSSNPGDNLSQFLDPGNTGATSLNGSNDPCGSPGGGGDDCVTEIPYSEDDPCVIVVIAADDYCCDTEWDDICEDAYVACSSGDECEAGTVSVATNQNVCPGETGIFDATGVSIPAGGGYAVQFVPDGGTGGNEIGFSITAVQPLPFEFDNDINGVLSSNGLPPLAGAWLVTGFAYTDPEDAGGSFCSITEIDVTVNFLAADHPSCGGSGGDNNDDCANAILVAPGVHPFSTVGATTDGPDQPGSACDVFSQSNVNNDVWFEYTASCDGVSSFSTCNTADFDTRIAVYPAGQCPPTAASLIICNDDGDDCTGYTSYLEWSVVEGESYLLRIGGYSAADFGEGTFELIEDCGATGEDCNADIPYPEDDPCVITVTSDDPFCCDSAWDDVCELSYQICIGEDPDCNAVIPYPISDPCVIQVIADDPFCCDNTWDNVCEDLYQDCLNTGDDCLDWVEPSATTGWDNFNTEFGGAPANEGEGCPTYEITDFEVWMSEAYAMDNIVAGTSYTFSHCNGPGAGTWVPEYTIITPSGAIDTFGAGDGDGCSITWTASESGTYLIVINEAGNCGVAAQIDNGFPAITCNDAVTSIEETESTVAFQVFPNPNNGQFVVELNGSGGLAQVDILEVSGKVVQSAQMNFAESTFYQVELGGHASGMYFVRITMNNHMYVERVVVQ